MKKRLIIGNWKMNLNMHESSVYLHKLMDALPVHRDVEVVVAPTTLTLQSLSLQINRRIAKLAAQNCYWRDSGAYTGEIPAAHLRGIAEYALIGHSERRHVFGERDKDIRLKVQAALRSHIRPVLCVGETVQERTAGETKDVLVDQITSGLANVTVDDLSEVVIAYEPVWAIGTGECAKPTDVKEAVRMIRRHIAHLYGRQAAAAVRVLYGGSVTKDNATTFLSQPGIDGLLIGGASLDIYQFSEIVSKAHNKAL